MANTLIPLMNGHDYQARFFWLQACRLFKTYQKVIRVGYELDDVKSFDDVAVFYSQPIPDVRGDLVQTDYYQIKFHVNQAGAFTYESLIDPKFIGAETVSLLQRLHQAQKKFAPTGTGCRFYMVSPWGIHPDDNLSKIISNNDSELRLQVLFDGSGSASAMGKVRSLWRNHLGLSNDDELTKVLLPLRIKSNAESLESLRQRLNENLGMVGLSPVNEWQRNYPYDDLIRKLSAEGHKEFSRGDIERICRGEGLWNTNLVVTNNMDSLIHIGIRSFTRWAEYMEDETTDMLCLTKHFNGRNIIDHNLWHSTIFSELACFLSKVIKGSQQYCIHLDTHSSIAFAAGYYIGAKSGAYICLLQRTFLGKVMWIPTQSPTETEYSGLSYNILEKSSKTEVVIAISITHNILNDVDIFVEQNLPNVGRIIHCQISPEPSNTAVKDGTHALILSQDIARFLKNNRSTSEKRSLLHIFYAAPNGMVFFLGQVARSFGQCVLYEYDFDISAPGAYGPTFTFPYQ